MTTKSVGSLSGPEQEALAERFMKALTDAVTGGVGLVLQSDESIRVYHKQFADLAAITDEYAELAISAPLSMTMGLLRGTVTRLDALTKRVAELEARPELKYLGLHESGATYRSGSVVTSGGSLWVAMQDTAAEPGGEAYESRAWRLAVKRGKDGKDLR